MGTFTVDADSTGTGRGTWEPFIDTWNDRMGDQYPLPEFSASTVDGFQGTMRSVALEDTAVNELWASSPVSTRAVGTYEHDQIRLYVGLRGTVALQDPHDQGGDTYVSAGTAVAAHLHVSVRTLQRAFAGLDESFSAYIRSRRLEEAAEALTAAGSRLSVSEAAARWHFTDGSHFIRAFKKQYHATPAQFARRLT
ncbi:helix-turn-helix domain-containing protein [Actinacidiphila paucisporea]|uniref:Helix-turn-helix domain-containing protein n=1 Tax=Actinacidiphila paucisporea TaxID=310782 RepID=A0A1M7M1F9_9ACTN|nr:helix-turn-helix domain-containing protein [Actinacidiphila paucisporea]SHM84001.1 Helix-turn-helix domain-containing protein [Actinacidiphila paucisporea]